MERISLRGGTAFFMVTLVRCFLTVVFWNKSNKIYLSCMLFILSNLMSEHKQFSLCCRENVHFKSIQTLPFRLICSCVGVLDK